MILLSKFDDIYHRHDTDRKNLIVLPTKVSCWPIFRLNVIKVILFLLTVALETVAANQ